MSEKITLKWKRPSSVEYPKIWHTFKARDIDSDDLVEYRIVDVPKSRADDVYEHMRLNYILDEPVGQAFGSANDPLFYADYKHAWESMVEQCVPLVCFKDGSDEIVGVNMNFVMSQEDNFMRTFSKQMKGEVTKNVFDVLSLMYTSFDPFECYGVTEFMASFGLSVDRKYRGRSIGDQFLATRGLLCKEFGLKLTHTIFSSDFSNRNADKVGFKADVIINYADVVTSYPQYALLKNIKSRQMTLKTLVY